MMMLINMMLRYVNSTKGTSVAPTTWRSSEILILEINNYGNTVHREA
jgi:hypothetical protein